MFRYVIAKPLSVQPETLESPTLYRYVYKPIPSTSPTSMLILFLTHLLWTAPLVGWGLLSVNLMAFRKAEATPVFVGEAGLIGFLPLAILTSLTNFFLPLGTWFASLFWFGGGIAFLRLAPHLLEKMTWAKTGGLVTLIMVASLTTHYTEFVYDFGQYHLPATRWAIEEAHPLGLGNFNQFIAYNSIWFSLVAGLNLPRWGLAALMNAETYAVVFFIFYLFSRCFEKDGAGLNRSFFLALILQCVVINFLGHVGTGSSDAMATIFVLLAICSLLEQDKGETTRSEWLTFCYVVFAVCIKLSTALFAAGVVAIWFFLITRRSFFSREKFIYLLPGLLLGALWMLRGLMTSGCLAFPIAKSCLTHLPWYVTGEVASVLVNDIRRSAGSCLGGEGFSRTLSCVAMDSLPKVFRSREVAIFLLFSIAGALFIWRKRGTTVFKNVPVSPLLILLVILLVVCNLFWIFQAPNVRFGVGFLMGLSALIAMPAMTRIQEILRPAFLKFGFLLVFTALTVFRTYRWTHKNVIAHDRAPEVTTKVIHGSGLPYVIPATIHRCWNVPVPCTYAEVPRLQVSKTKDGRYFFSLNPVMGILR